MRIRLDVAYEGTRYAGWQIQPDRPTVQSALEDALRRVYGRHMRLAGASRTDAGVHALQQVAHFNTQPDDVAVPPEKVREATQRYLPNDIAILATREQPEDWHSIASVTSKRYRFLIWEAEHAHPMLSRFTWRVPIGLDLAAMQQAATEIVGTHDFACFETTGAPRKSTVRTIYELTLREVQPGLPYSDVPVPGHIAGRLLELQIEGDGFLYNMVRTIAGTLVKVGRGRWDAGDVARIIASADRNLAGETAPAAGLCLMRVRYDESTWQDE